MAEPRWDQHEIAVMLTEEVLGPLHEIRNAAKKLRPEATFSHSDVIRILLEVVDANSYNTHILATKLVDVR